MKTALPTDMADEHQDQDARAVAAIKKGDRERYRELIERYERQVYTVAWCRLGDADLAEEAAQEAFIKGYRHLAFLGQGKKFGAWLMAITRNVAINLGMRHRNELKKRERWALDQSAATAKDASEETQAQERESFTTQSLRESLAELPAHHRESLALFYLEGKSITEASGLLGVSENTFKSRLHRARLALRERLEAQLGESLEQLRPRQTLAPAIMGLMAAERMEIAAATGGMAGFLSKILPGIAKFLPIQILFAAGLIPLALIVPTLLLARRMGNIEQEEFKDRKGFRAVLHRRSLRTMLFAFPLLFLVGFKLLGILNLSSWGPQTLFLVLGFGMLLLLPSCTQQLLLRGDRLSFYHLCSITVTCVGSLAIGFFDLSPRSIGFLMAISSFLAAAALPLQPWGRMDWSLFLRAVQDLVPEAPNNASVRPYTRLELLAFSRFLGERWLISKRSERARGFRFRLRPVQPAWIIAMFQSLWGGQSELVLSFDGRIEARLGRADEDQLKNFPDAKPFSKERLEEQVAAAVREAMNAFLTGNVSEAERWLGQQPLQAIFVHASENRPRKHVRWTASVMAVIGLLNLVLWCYSFFDHPTPGPSLKPVNLSENEVRAALAREPRTNRFTDEALPEGADLGLITWPPKSLFTPEIWQRLLDKQGLNLVPDLKFGPDFMTGRLMADQKIQHAFLSGMITKSDLAERGITEEAIRIYFRNLGPRNALEMTQLSHGELLTVSQEFRLAAALRKHRSGKPLMLDELAGPPLKNETPRIAIFASLLEPRLQVLHEFGCFDLVDTKPLIEQLRTRQVIPGNTITNGPVAKDYKQLRGLFFYGANRPLQDTYYALALLALVDGLRQIDQTACAKGILRFHRGRGHFGPLHYNDSLAIFGDAEETFYAYESLRFLGALGRVKDLEKWEFRPMVGSHLLENGKPRPMDWREIQAWLWQERLNRYIEARRKDPSTPAPSLMMDE